MKSGIYKITAALILLLTIALTASASAVGDNVYTNTRLLADNLEYVNSMAWDETIGRTESFAIRMTGPGDAYPIVLNGDTIYGGYNISRLTEYAEELGKNVLAVINADFFAQNAVPIGIVIEDGIYKSGAAGRNAVAFGYDGGVSIIESPDVLITLNNNGGADDIDNAGMSVSVWHFNKARSDNGGLMLYSDAFSSVSTRTSSPGWFVRFRILEGEMTVSGSMLLEVVEVLESEGAIPIGEEYLVLSAADDSDLYDEYVKFAVGDIVTLLTECADPRLANAQ